MLVVISDLHLGDGSCGRSVSPDAFQLFVHRLKELAFYASWREEKYRPIESIEVLLLGDILDVLHSTRWLDREIGDPGYVRPWTDVRAPEYAAKVEEITMAILAHNAQALAVFQQLHQEGISIPPADRHRRPATCGLHRAIRVPVRFYYMVGNHDWYYHLSGAAFDRIRAQVIRALALENLPSPFPYSMEEYLPIQQMADRYGVYARHGDYYDSLNYDHQRGRDAASLGDVFSVEMINRFPLEVERRLGNELPPALIAALRELTNVRPILATPLWVSGQLRQNQVPLPQQKKLKEVWDDLSDRFLRLDIVRQADQRFRLDIVDGLQALLSLSRRASFKTLDEIVVWLRKHTATGDVSFTRNALRESAFLERKSQFIVYGHTHHHEIVPLDRIPAMHYPTNQIYLNAGTWHTYYDLAVYKPKEQKFVPYQVFTYLAFYRGDERGSRRFEAWSGALSDSILSLRRTP